MNNIQPELFFSILTSIISFLVGLLVSILIYQINGLSKKVDNQMVLTEFLRTKILGIEGDIDRHEQMFTKVFAALNDKVDRHN